MNLFTLLNSNNYATYNREIAKKIGLHEAIMLSELVSWNEFLHDKLIPINGEEGFFYLTIESAEERTCLARKAQDSCIRFLQELGFVTYIVKGSPPRRYFKLHEDKILAYFGIQKIPTNLYQTDKSICTKRTNQYVSADKSVLYNKEPNERTKEKKEESASPIPTAIAAELSTKFFSAIKKTKDNFREPNFKKWELEIDKMLRVDKISPERIHAVIDWLPSDDFWKVNILSAEKLRLQFFDAV